MRHKKLIAVTVLGLAIFAPAQATVTSTTLTLSTPVILPNISQISGVNANAPSGMDFTFDSRGLNVSVAQNGGNSYTLTANGNGNFSFYGPTTYPIAGNATSYSLVANFSVSNNNVMFNSAGSTLEIQGTLTNPSALPANVTPPSSSLLFDANLTGFGYNVAQGDLGFQTQFLPSWSNQAGLTGGSTSESVYLIDQGALLDGGYGRLTQLVEAVQQGNLSAVSGMTYSNIEALVVLPLPLPAVLFGSGLTALVGLSYKRRASN